MSWEDDLIAVEVRVQQNLLAVATVSNRSQSKQTVPAFVLSAGSTLNSYDILDSNGKQLTLDAVHADWYIDDRPVIELGPGRSYSEAVDLRRAFPSLTEGDFVLRFTYGAIPGPRSTWKGTEKVLTLPMTVRRLVG